MRPFSLAALAALLVLALAACQRSDEPTNVTAPGADKTLRTQALEAGAALLQDSAPVDRLNTYVCGFHFVSGDMTHQMEAHHYCTDLNEDFTQCALYDGNGRDAKLIGVEYIISARLFETLPEEEKRLWHSHVYEVKSGTLIAPGLPDVAERELMEKMIGTYGKTWHTWDTHAGHELPLGIPHLMMAFTADGQLDPNLQRERDTRMDVSTAETREDRAEIPAPPVLPGADAWLESEAVQLDLIRADAAGNMAPDTQQ